MNSFTSLRTLLLLALLGLAAPATWGQVTRVKDIRPGSDYSNPDKLTNVNGTLYFVADDGVNGLELWKSDGTEQGTVLVKNINPTGDSSPDRLTAVGNTVFFTANNGTNGYELWKSDGTEQGTVLVKDIQPGANNSNVLYLAAVGNTLFFHAIGDSKGPELWKSDGTEQGTVLVKDITAGSSGSFPSNLTAVGNTLYFKAGNSISDQELWKSDGTEQGTVRVKDINPGMASSFPANLTAVGTTLFFTASNGTNGQELWKSDGTEQGTVLVKDIWTGADESAPANLLNFNGTLYFIADDGTNGYELWKSDGTEQGTVLVKDLGEGISAFPYALTIMNGKLYFFANNTTCGIDLYQTDGTAAGTKRVYTFENYPDGGVPKVLVASGNLLYFFAYEPVNGQELWQSDGTTAGTKLAKDINPGSASSYPNQLTDVNGTLFFAAEDAEAGRELWKASFVPPCDTRVAGAPLVPARLCLGQNLPLSFALVGACPQPEANLFQVQLSNAAGSFVNPTNLGNVLPGANAIAGSLLAGVTPGPFYRVRLVAGGQVLATSAPFVLEAPSLALTPVVGKVPVCRGSQVTLSFNPAGCPFPQGNAFTAQLSNALGNFNNPTNLGAVLAGQVNNVTIPQGVAAGTGYRIRVVSSNPTTASTASAAFQVRACNARLSAEEAELVVAPNPARGGEIRVRVSGMDNPAFSLTTAAGRGLGITTKTDGSGEFVLTPKQPLSPGIYAVQASEGQTRITRRVLVSE